MLTSTALYKSALHAPHQRAFRVDLYSGTGELLQRGIPVLDGAITANMDNRVSRSGSFTVGPEFWPMLATDVLTPYQTVAKVFAGMRYGDGSEELFQLIEGRVGDVEMNADGLVTARVDDRAADVVGFEFESPRNSERIPLLNQIRRLITEALPDAVFGPDDVDTTAITPKLTWDTDRGDALDALAGALGARWYQLGNGSFVVRLLPYDVGTPVQDLFDGEGGLLFTGAPKITRDGAANSVTLTVERADGGTPFRVQARDTSPSSPTMFDGPFGRVSKLIKAQTPLTVGQATTMTRAELEASTALSSQWDIACQADYTLEPGDTVRTRITRHTLSRQEIVIKSTQLIDQITYPLFDTEPMIVHTRAFVRAPATVN